MLSVYVVSLRCESMLQMAMFRHRRDSALKHSRTLAEHFKVSLYFNFFCDVHTCVSVCLCVCVQNTSCSASPVRSSCTVVIPQPIHQVAASYVEVTALFLNALERWEQADEVALRGSGKHPARLLFQSFIHSHEYQCYFVMSQRDHTSKHTAERM